MRPAGALDRAAAERGNSVYFPDRVVPMLPERLSNDLCSLRPDEDRPALAVHLWIDADGKKRRHRFVRATMRSAARLTYRQIQNDADGLPTEGVPEGVRAPLYAAYHALRRARQARGTLDLDLPERRIVMNDEGRIESVATRHRYDSHRLIEEFMILANVAAAEALEAQRAPVMYRVHEAPSEEKLEALRAFLASLEINLAKGQVLQARQFERILARAVGHAARAHRQRDDPAQPGAGRLPPGKCGPFRPRAAPLLPLHLADPALCRPSGPSRADHRLRVGRWRARRA